MMFAVYLLDFFLLCMYARRLEHMLLTAGDYMQHHADHHYHSDRYYIYILLIFTAYVIPVSVMDYRAF
jgi:hypothetical protein